MNKNAVEIKLLLALVAHKFAKGVLFPLAFVQIFCELSRSRCLEFASKGEV